MTEVTPPVHEAPSRAVRILVIDDNAMLARSFARMLRAHDCEVETDPKQAVARIEAGEQFAVVICDLRMPDLDGRGVLQAIRAYYTTRPGMPQVVLMSGSDELDREALATPVLQKPCHATELRSLVARLLESPLS